MLKLASGINLAMLLTFSTTHYVTYSSPVFHIETSHLICSANQMIGFYMKCDTGLKLLKKMRMYVVIVILFMG